MEVPGVPGVPGVVGEVIWGKSGLKWNGWVYIDICRGRCGVGSGEGEGKGSYRYTNPYKNTLVLSYPFRPGFRLYKAPKSSLELHQFSVSLQSNTILEAGGFAWAGEF